jgi:hypothetical protein
MNASLASASLIAGADRKWHRKPKPTHEERLRQAARIDMGAMHQTPRADQTHALARRLLRTQATTADRPPLPGGVSAKCVPVGGNILPC